jgi:two-component system, NtrC family, sensor kinase
MLPSTLKSKVVVYLAVGMTAVVTVFTLLAVHHQREQLLASAVSHLTQLSEMIVRSTRFAMLQDQRYHVHRIIQDIANDGRIDRIRIFSKEGVIIDSTHSAEIGTMIDRKAEACFSCHGEKPSEQTRTYDRARVFTTPVGKRMLATMQVINNEPSCHSAGCHVHPPHQAVLGVVDIVYSLDEIDTAIQSNALRVVGLALGFVLLASLCVSLLVHRLVYRPLRDLESGAKRLAQGDLDHAIPVRSTDEFGQLARSFNTMTDALRRTQGELREAAQSLEHKVQERTDQLRQAEAEAARSEKLASVGLLAAGIAHELNNPLTGVLTFSHLTRQKLPDGSTEAEDMDLVIRETKRCATIIRRLLDFARQKTPETKFSDINQLVRDTVHFIERPAHLHDTEVNLDLDPDLPQVWVDEDQIKQVVMNMLVNAQHATERGGSITLRTRRASAPGSADSGAEPAPMVEIAIIDTGCGIPEKSLPRIFDPFFTSKEVGKGTGLGLSVSHGIVEAHGGTIRVESAVGKGSTFYVYLPVAPRRKPDEQQGAGAPA